MKIKRFLKELYWFLDDVASRVSSWFSKKISYILERL